MTHEQSETATVHPRPVIEPGEVGLLAALDLLEVDAPVPVVIHPASRPRRSRTGGREGSPTPCPVRCSSTSC